MFLLSCSVSATTTLLTHQMILPPTFKRKQMLLDEKYPQANPHSLLQRSASISSSFPPTWDGGSHNSPCICSWGLTHTSSCSRFSFSFAVHDPALVQSTYPLPAEPSHTETSSTHFSVKKESHFFTFCQFSALGSESDTHKTPLKHPHWLL